MIISSEEIFINEDYWKKENGQIREVSTKWKENWGERQWGAENEDNENDEDEEGKYSILWTMTINGSNEWWRLIMQSENGYY